MQSYVHDSLVTTSNEHYMHSDVFSQLRIFNHTIVCCPSSKSVNIRLHVFDKVFNDNGDLQVKTIYIFMCTY